MARPAQHGSAHLARARQRGHACPTTRATSPSSKASRPSASAPACTSAPPASAACTTSSTRSSTTPSTRPSPATATPSTSRSSPTAACASSDNGRGIPVDIVESEGKPAVEVVLTVLHAGGKFGGGGYAVSGGLHGVGVSVVNALSTRVEVEVKPRRRRGPHGLRVRRPTGPLRSGARPPTSTGTTVTFWADGEIFETTHYDFETLSRRFQEMAFLNKGLTLVLTDEREPDPIDVELDGVDPTEAAPRAVTYHYEGGIADFVKHLNATKGPSAPARDPRRVRGHRAPDLGRGRDAVELAATPSRSTRSPTRSTRSRAAPTRRASARRSPRWSTSSPASGACSRRRTPTSPARTSARASPRSCR